MDNLVIQIVGKMRVGKSTIASMLTDKISNSTELAFASPLKDILSGTLGITLEELEVLKNNPKNPHRGYLERLSDQTKEVWGEDIYVDNMKWRVANLPKHKVVIISDTRYQNEVLKGSYVIHVKREGVKATSTHRSETGTQDILSDLVVHNDGSLDSLEILVDNLIYKLKVSRVLP